MVSRSLVICLALIAFTLISPPRAKADEVFTWTLPASPPVAMAGSDFAFEVTGVPLSENGSLLGDFIMDFYNVDAISPVTGVGGGFDALLMGSASLLNETGPQLYSGPAGFPESMPTFVAPGTYGPFTGTGTASTGLTGTLVISDGGNGNDLFTYTLSTPAAVPEPSSLLLIGTGALSLLGFARRKLLG